MSAPQCKRASPSSLVGVWTLKPPRWTRCIFLYPQGKFTYGNNVNFIKNLSIFQSGKFTLLGLCCHHHHPLVGVWSLRDERDASFYIRFHPFCAWSLPPDSADFHICSPSSPSPSPSRSPTFYHHPLSPILCTLPSRIMKTTKWKLGQTWSGIISSCDNLRRVVITLYQVGIHVCKSNVHQSVPTKVYRSHTWPIIQSPPGENWNHK